MSAASRRVLVLNGPNLGRLGAREPEVYGSVSYAELEALCVGGGSELGLDVEVRQTEHEGELLDWLHSAADEGTPVVLNAGALTHTSVALGDACAMLTAALKQAEPTDQAWIRPLQEEAFSLATEADRRTALAQIN